MSWFSELAGKAEGLLNHLDQSAATALQKPSSPSSSTPQKQTYSYRSVPAAESGVISQEKHAQDFGEFSGQGQGGNIERSRKNLASQSAVDLAPKREQRSSGYASSVSSVLGSKSHGKGDEEKLIDYLNESAPEQASRTPEFSSTERPPTVSLSRHSSSSSLRSLPAHLLRSNGGGGITEIQMGTEKPVEEATALNAAPSASYSQIATTFVQATGSERELNELRARESDLQKALQAKDSQLAVLRVRLQEADQQLQMKSQTLKRLENEQERLLKDSADSSAYRNQALETIQQQMTDAQSALDRERFEAKQSENDYLSRIQKLENEQCDIGQQLTAVQKTLTEEKMRCKQVSEQLKLAKYNLEANKQEFDEYKQKAQRTLQSKDKLIATLKENNGEAMSEQTGVAIELEELRTERDILKEDLQQAQLHLYNMKAEFQELESQSANEQRMALEQQYQLQEQCQQFQHSAAQYREQLEQLKQEYQYMQDEARRLQFALQAKLQEKDAELNRLMNQVSSRSALGGNESTEYENRIRQLTESLIQKQTVIETLQTDKQSLSLQLERMERLYREAEGAAITASTTIHIGSSEEGVHARVPAFLRENPYDTGVARGVKRAYSTLDSLSVKVGVFLRRYPAARVCVFCYMVLLHIWVMVVLLTYTPEMHSSDYHEPRPLK